MFKKGQSGNPKGRQKKAEELKLVETIVSSGKSKTGTDNPLFDLWAKIWEQAIEGSQQHQRFILEFAYGKPEQIVKASVTGDMPTLIFKPSDE